MFAKLHKFIPPLVWMICIYYFSSVPDLPATTKIDILDFLTKKLAHVIEYTILFFLWYRALGEKSPQKAFLISLCYAFTDEIHQLFVPGRTGRLRDVAIDSIGMIISFGFIVKFGLWKILLSQPHTKRLKK